MTRLSWAILTFLGVVGLANLTSETGHGYWPLVVLCLGSVVGAKVLSERVWAHVFTALLAISVVFAGLAAFQIAMQYTDRARIFFGSANFFGGYAALHLFLALHGRERGGKLPALAIGANILSLGLAQSRGAIVAAGAGLFVYFLSKRPRLALGLGLLSVALVLTVTTVQRVNGFQEPRWGLWMLGLKLASERLVLGWGQNAIMLWPLGWSRFYNEIIDWLVVAGILGVSAGTWMLYEAARACRERPALLAFLVAWIVNGMFIFDTAATTIPLFVVLAYAARTRLTVLPDRNDAIITVIVDNHQPLADRRRIARRLHVRNRHRARAVGQEGIRG